MKPQERRSVERLLHEGTWFRGLPDSLRGAILDRSVLRAYKKGTLIAAEGSPSEGLFAILEGRVAWTRSIGPSDKMLLYVAGQGAWFGHLALVRDTPCQFNVVAHAAARLLVLPRAQYQLLIEEDPEHFRRIADVALERMELLIRIYAESRKLSAEDLIPARLATLAGLRRAETRQTGGAIRLALSQEEVAAILGVSRQTLNSVLKRLEAAGLIEVGFRELVIPDAACLPDVAAARSVPRAGRNGDSAYVQGRPQRTREQTPRRA
jgi:CRP-like cAMP-binding protein